MADEIILGAFRFDQSSYGAAGGIPYLNRGEPQEATESVETVDGHVLRIDSDGRVVGITILNPRGLIEQGRSTNLAIPIDDEKITTLLREVA